jgi:hypothetical protein
VVRQSGFYEVRAASAQPYLRHYHVRYSDLDVFLFFNEHPYQAIDTILQIPGEGRALAYNPFKNQVSELVCAAQGDRLRFRLSLTPYESATILVGPGIRSLPAEKSNPPGSHQTEIRAPWSVSAATAEQYPAFEPWKTLERLADLSQPGEQPSFSGTFRYCVDFDWAGSGQPVRLDLGDVFETAEVWVNGQPAGVCICPPYRFEIGQALRPGKNTLVVEVTNTLGKDQRDYFSRFAQQEPSGLLGPVRLVF